MCPHIVSRPQYGSRGEIKEKKGKRAKGKKGRRREKAISSLHSPFYDRSGPLPFYGSAIRYRRNPTFGGRREGKKKEKGGRREGKREAVSPLLSISLLLFREYGRASRGCAEKRKETKKEERGGTI